MSTEEYLKSITTSLTFYAEYTKSLYFFPNDCESSLLSYRCSSREEWGAMLSQTLGVFRDLMSAYPPALGGSPV